MTPNCAEAALFPYDHHWHHHNPSSPPEPICELNGATILVHEPRYFSQVSCCSPLSVVQAEMSDDGGHSDDGEDDDADADGMLVRHIHSELRDGFESSGLMSLGLNSH